jgi:ABC-2 type transport system permease protein
MRYYLVIVRSVILKGVGISSLWFEAGALLFMGVMVLVASVLRFKSKLD